MTDIFNLYLKIENVDKGMVMHVMREVAEINDIVSAVIVPESQ
jgi:hypothetical protein